VFAYFAAGLAVWNLGVFGLRSAVTPDAAMTWEQFLHVGVIAIPALFYHYVVIFLDASRGDYRLRFGYLACATFIAVSPTPLFMRGVAETDWGFMPVVGPFYWLFLLYFNAYLILGLIRLLRARRSMASSVMRNRAQLVVFGVVVSLLGAVVDFIRFVFHWDWLYPVGIPTNMVFGLSLGLAILRYRLMDVRLLAKRLIVYLLVSMAFAPVLVAGLWLMAQLPLGSQDSHASAAHGTLWRDGLLLSVLLAMALPMLKPLEAALDRHMFHRQHGVRDALLELSNQLPRLLDRQRLAETLTASLVARIPAMHATLHLQTSSAGLQPAGRAESEVASPGLSPVEITPALAGWLQMTGRTLAVEETVFHGDAVPAMRAVIDDLARDRVALLVPLFLEGRLGAVLSVGEKLSGSVYEADEIELLEMLLREAAIALENAGLYADLHEQMQELRRAQGQLMRSAKLAAIGELSASVAHEINNPLMVILGLSGLLRRQSALAPVHDKLATIETEAVRAGTIIRGLLDFSRRREPTLQRLDVQEVIERALSLLEGKLTSRAIDVQLVIGESGAYVVGDRDELTQVFVNLAGNAADAMPGGGHLSISTEILRYEEMPYVSIRMSDTGPGIPADDLPHVFEPFFTTKPEGEGTGLGLSITQGIIKRHEGTVGVESAPGKGTTIVVNLPEATAGQLTTV
jgi:signal transduction histidine kinase